MSRAQLLRADRQCFVEMARACNGRLKKAPAGKLPLDDTIAQSAQFHAMPEIMMLLLPTMQTGKGKGKGDKGKGQKRKIDDGSEASPAKKPKLTRDGQTSRFLRRPCLKRMRKSRNTGRRGTFGTSGKYGASRILT